MKHPYEAGGIMFTIAILGGILGGVALDNWHYEYDKPSSPAGGSTLEKYIPMFPKPVYDNHVVDEMQECKNAAKDLQEFYDCVNG